MSLCLRCHQPKEDSRPNSKYCRACDQARSIAPVMSRWWVVFRISDCVAISCMVEGDDPREATEQALFTLASTHPKFSAEAALAYANGRVYLKAEVA